MQFLLWALCAAFLVHPATGGKLPSENGRVGRITSGGGGVSSRRMMASFKQQQYAGAMQQSKPCHNRFIMLTAKNGTVKLDKIELCRCYSTATGQATLLISQLISQLR